MPIASGTDGCWHPHQMHQSSLRHGEHPGGSRSLLLSVSRVLASSSFTVDSHRWLRACEEIGLVGDPRLPDGVINGVVSVLC